MIRDLMTVVALSLSVALMLFSIRSQQNHERYTKLIEPRAQLAPVALLTPDGVFLVRLFAIHEMTVFAKKGEYLQTIGRNGEGPGEFQGIHSLVALPDGGIAAIDPANARLTYFTPELEMRSEHPIPVRISRFGAVRLPNGDFILAGHMNDWNAFGSPLAPMDSTGKLLAYFGRMRAGVTSHVGAAGNVLGFHRLGDFWCGVLSLRKTSTSEGSQTVFSCQLPGLFAESGLTANGGGWTSTVESFL